MEIEYRRGDWVRYYNNGALVIGEVCYVTKDVRGCIYLHTDGGCLSESSVLECRPPQEEKSYNKTIDKPRPV